MSKTTDFDDALALAAAQALISGQDSVAVAITLITTGLGFMQQAFTPEQTAEFLRTLADTVLTAAAPTGKGH